MLLKIFTWLAQKLFHRTFVVGDDKVYGLAMVKEKTPYFSPADVNWGEIKVTAFTFDDFTAKRYKEGKLPGAFLLPEHAEEASRRLQKVLKDYHEELGY